MPELLKPPVGHPHYAPEPATVVPQKENDMTTRAAKAKYNELKNKIAEAKKQMEDTAMSAFNEMAADLFVANPNLVAFGWTQYTPYFNDGDACTFSANTSYPAVTMLVDGETVSYDSNSGDLTVNGEEVVTEEEYKRKFKSLGPKTTSFVEDGKTIAYDPATGVITRDGNKIKDRDDYTDMFDSLEEKVSDFLGVFEDDDLKVMFGDHVRVIVNRDGKVEKEEYEHD